MIRDYSKIAIKNLKKRKLRSWLTMIGIIISIATIFVLISVSIGLQNAVKEQFRQLGTDKFFIQPKGQLGVFEGGAFDLTEEDVKVIRKISGVKELTWMVIGNAKLKFKDQIRYVLVIGFDIDTSKLFSESGTFEALDGRSLKKGDYRKVELGYDFKYSKYLKKPIDVGDTVLINDIPFKVISIVKKIGNPQDDRQVYLPIEEMRKIFNIPERVDTIIVQIDEGQEIDEVVERVDKKLMKFRNVNEKTKDYTILTPEELLKSFGNILNIITGFLAGVAAISLIVGSIGIANTMYTSVLERTKEIGVMKAVGAKNKDILLIFLIEAGFLGFIGGLIGILFGYGVAKILEWIAINQLGTTLLKAVAPSYLILGCLVFAFLSGAISGIWPAWRASRINVVDALRYE